MPIFRFFKRRAFRRAFRKAVADGALSPEDVTALNATGVDQAYADEVRLKHFLKVTADLRQAIETSRRMSPEQEAELAAVACRLGIAAEFDPTYATARDLWLAENEGQSLLRPIETAVNLRPGETCYFDRPAQWYRLKTIRRRTGYAGFATSVRIVRGVSFRVGNVTPSYDESEEMTLQSEGALLITDRRVIFHGERKSTTVALGRILAVERFETRLELSKASGPNDTFELSVLDSDLASAILEQALALE